MKYFAIAMLVLVAGCGGKILDERTGAAVDEPSSTTLEAAPAPPAARGTRSTSADPCTVICEGNGGCVGGQSECYRRCAEDLASERCGAEADAYLRCYADRIEVCSALPPACENAYCAYARCAGRVVPAYCR